MLGGNIEDFYGLVDSLCFNDFNEIAEMLLNDPKLPEKYPSFK